MGYITNRAYDLEKISSSSSIKQPTVKALDLIITPENPLLRASLAQNIKIVYICAAIVGFLAVFYLPCYISHLRSVRGGRGWRLSKKNPKHQSPLNALPTLKISPSFRASVVPTIKDYLTGTPIKSHYSPELEEAKMMSFPQPSPLNITYDRKSAHFVNSRGSPLHQSHQKFQSFDSVYSDESDKTVRDDSNVIEKSGSSNLPKEEDPLAYDFKSFELLGGKLSLIRKFHGIYSILDTFFSQTINIPFFQHVTLSQFIVLASLSGCFAVAIATSQGPGQISSALIPFVAATASKNSLLSVLCGKNYSQLNFLHRVMGRLLFLAGLLHTIAWMIYWAQYDQLSSKMARSTYIYGAVGISSLILMIITSLPPVRRKLYGIFAWSHVLGFAGFLVGLYLHSKGTLPYVVSGAVLYTFDIIVRHIKTHKTEAILTPLANGSTLVRLPQIKSGWEAGQHVWLRVGIPGAFGGWHEVSHPFTISNAEDRSGLKLVIASSGDWTKALHTYAKTLRQEDPENFNPGKATCLVEGPYTSTGQWDVGNHSMAMLIAGGSGASYITAMAEELLLRSIRGEVPKLRKIDMIWSVRSYQHLMVFSKTISKLQTLAISSPNPTVTLSVRLFVSAPADREGLSSPMLGASLRTSRPDLYSIMDQAISDLLRAKETHGLSICVCGPLRLVNGTKHALQDIPVSKRYRIGGARIHAEMFSF